MIKMKNMLKSKKGLIYLFATIVLVSIAIIVLIINTSSNNNSDQAVFSRINAMNDFLNDMESDFQRVTYISGFRAFLGINQYISETGEFLENYQEVFLEVFYNGSINSTPYEVMNNATFKDYITRVEMEADKIGVKLNITLNNVSLYQKDPWGIYIDMNMSIFANDTSNVASWNVTKNFETRISLDNVRDPLYSVHTIGRLPNAIVKSPYSQNEFVASDNTTEALYNHTMNSYYRASTLGPSFVMRLQGNYSASPYGIESFVNLDDLDAQGFIIDNSKSIVDYNYFGNITTNNYCTSKGNPLPTWFKLDEDHYNSVYNNYEIDELNATSC